jgi:hypothetical protein
VAPSPASVNTQSNVKVERPYFGASNTVPGQVVQASGDTKVQTWDSGTVSYKQNEGGIQTAVNTGNRAFGLTSGNGFQGNMPSTQLFGGGGTPFSYTGGRNVVGPAPNTDVGVNSGAGPTLSRGSGFSFGPSFFGLGR